MSYETTQACCLGSAYRPQNYQKINPKNYKNRRRAKPLIFFLFNFFYNILEGSSVASAERSVATIPIYCPVAQIRKISIIRCYKIILL